MDASVLGDAFNTAARVVTTASSVVDQLAAVNGRLNSGLTG